MAQNIIYIDNDNVIELIGLKDVTQDTFVNDASVTVTLLDSSGDEVSGQAWPFILVYVSGSDGDYRATLEDGLVLSFGGTYTAIVIADAGADLIGKWTVKVVAKIRKSV